MRMSLIESDLKSRIEEEIREIAERRASEIIAANIEDHLSKTAESPCAERAPVRSVAPTMLDEAEIIAAPMTAARSVPPVRSVPPSPNSAPPPAYSAPPPSYGSYSSPPSSFSGPPSPYSVPPSSSSPYSMPPGSLAPPRSFAPPSSYPGSYSSPNYIVWPEASTHAAIQAVAPRRSNALLLAVAALALMLSTAAFVVSTGATKAGPTASSARPLAAAAQPEQAMNNAPLPAFEENAGPAPTLAPSVPNAPRWSRRYQAPAGAQPAAPVAKAASPAAAPVKVEPVAAKAEAPAAPAAPSPETAPSPSMDQASKTAQLLREQLNSSVH